jgi:succinate dehydrogenase / fumarate reductase cytochrome b subunit
MPRKDTRPVFLNLLQIRLPVTGVVSILHRVSGVLLTVCIPLLFYSLQQSLTDPYFYQQATDFLSSLVGRTLTLTISGLLAFHFFSGIRHLLLDLDIGIERDAARRGAWLVMAMTLLTISVAWVVA